MSDVLISVKVYFKKDLIRRLSVSRTSSWAELRNILALGTDSECNTPSVFYLDEEGDSITVTSDVEWTECLRLQSDHQPVRLYVGKQALASAAKKMATVSLMSVDPEVCSPEQEASSQACAREQETLDKDVPKPEALYFYSAPTQGVNSQFAPLDTLTNTIPAFLRELGAPNHIPAWVEGAIKRIPSPGGDELLDVNIEAFVAGLSREAVAMLNRDQFGVATNLFTTLLSIKPTCATVMYNLACTYARAGDPSAALRHLERAVALGFSDFDHIQKDRDLESIRGSPVFERILKTRQDVSTQPSSASSDESASSTSQQPVLKCPAGHVLEVTTRPLLPSGRAYFQYVCDGCSAHLPASTNPVSHCQACEFDLCPDCAAVTVISVTSSSTAQPQQHRVRFSDTQTVAGALPEAVVLLPEDDVPCERMMEEDTTIQHGTPVVQADVEMQTDATPSPADATPSPAHTEDTSDFVVSPEYQLVVQKLVDMGFTLNNQMVAVVREADGKLEESLDRLMLQQQHIQCD